LRIFTVGHSSLKLEEFTTLLREFRMEVVADVRSYPYSRRFPHFSRDLLKDALRREGIEYVHIPQLGGLRREGYPAHMESEEFRAGLKTLTELAEGRRVALMCAERRWWECHRHFIAEVLLQRGFEVVHILGSGRVHFHPVPLR